MRQIYIQITVLMLVCLLFSLNETEVKSLAAEDSGAHNWQEYSTHVETVDVGTHEYTFWRNFIEHTGTCNISYKLKSVVYYCDVHDHTDAKIFHEETIHSEEHK
ncbi:hypothetical protein FH966_00960 [Lentibacillus cibarius]|uniref:Uncharacterized protein n=1 Tax=Lentibacillus cibarius TaxID=2583219 RepID=A0A549YET6_9BACI|nr:hypothetical protein [Lentibacillus cibarius]TMN21503.1 hypothetical protein FFL34_04805 [Lentibacillus cibarius]TRM10401.1 hypothetical protein FH966_00960 [Lentibacillus cibarius]